MLGIQPAPVTIQEHSPCLPNGTVETTKGNEYRRKCSARPPTRTPNCGTASHRQETGKRQIGRKLLSFPAESEPFGKMLATFATATRRPHPRSRSYLASR